MLKKSTNGVLASFQRSVRRETRVSCEAAALPGTGRVLARRGWAGEQAAFLSILRGVLLLFETYRPMKSRRAHKIFLQPARRGVGSRDVLFRAQDFFITIPRNA